ncbi:hypothetical protein TSUD_241890 [Trifolium subterraneum]|uniref:Reverse transcriptase domain-containing protein n=1 Tax=Trifolium subterraneum TaxID=3900 RepID=A0A2Z6LRZ9_TRISU|nr:hypothetical protein TSUD_241890 [Trifolium subterraneum]
MKTATLNFFKELFCNNQAVSNGVNDDGVPALDEVSMAELSKPVTRKEIFDALMSMKSYKAPGPDEFQSVFFKLFWNDIGDDLWKFVKLAFENGKYDNKVYETLIVLLPKRDNRVSFKDFCPISLCNVTYKLISKIIVSRPRPFLDGIVSPLKNSFIPGRSTKDNAIILKEVLHFMRKTKKKKGDMVFKLDLEKADDRVNWNFLKEMLELFKFPRRIISLIMFGIISSSNTILWNGSKIEAFTPMRGLLMAILCRRICRVVLANSVISSLPSYHMQICWLPQGMCDDDMDTTVRRFIWKGTGHNVSLLGKLIWEILNASDKLWVKLMTEKYLKGRLEMVTLNDLWVLKEKLCSMVPFVAIQDTTVRINEIWEDGRRNLEKLYTIVHGAIPTKEMLNHRQIVHHRMVAWACPSEGTVCLNVDGSMLGSIQTVGFGGLIRNKFGTFLKGFYGVASQPSVLYAEIIAVLNGLEYANDIQSIRQLLTRDWNVVINHTFREGNACADLLAKMGASASSPMVILEEPPSQLSSAFRADAWGVAFIRE